MLFWNEFTKSAMRTPGSPKLPSVVVMAGIGLTSSPPAAPHECMTCGQISPVAPGGGGLGATHSMVYGATGAAMAATRIWLFGSGFSALMSETNFWTGVRLFWPPASFEWQSDSVSVGGLPLLGGFSGGVTMAPLASL